jgi:lysozyme family protein
MTDFKVSYNKSMCHEGQYSNDPRDLGGETWKGISRKNWPTWEGWLVIDSIKRAVNAVDLVKALRADEELEEMVQEFYQANFYDNLKFNEINIQEIADELFDTAINQGAVKAVQYFQQALNLLNNNQKHYSDINEDGSIGPATIKAFTAYMFTSAFPGRSTERVISTLLKAMNGLQFTRYVAICEAKPEQEVYFFGWLNRV